MGINFVHEHLLQPARSSGVSGNMIGTGGGLLPCSENWADCLMVAGLPGGGMGGELFNEVSCIALGAEGVNVSIPRINLVAATAT